MTTTNPLAGPFAALLKDSVDIGKYYQQAVGDAQLADTAINQSAQDAIIEALTSKCQDVVKSLSEAITIRATVASSEVPPLAVAVFILGTGTSFALASGAKGLCTQASTSVLQDLQAQISSYQSFITSSILPLATTSQQSADIAAYTEALSSSDFAAMVSAANKFAADSNFVGVSDSSSGIAYEQNGIAALFTSSWQPTSLAVQNTDNTSQETVYVPGNSSIASIATDYSGPNETGPATEVDQTNTNDTLEVDNYQNIGGNGDNLTSDSNLIGFTNGSAMDTTVSITGGGIDDGSASPIAITNYGIITGSEWGINAYGYATIANFGSLVGGSDGIILYTGGNITNGSTADTTASIMASISGGLALNIGGANASQLSNFGTISGGIEAGQITITNGSATDTKASITDAAAGGDGAATGGATTLVNFGSVYGANDGLGLAGGSSVTNGSTADTSASISGGFGVVFGGNGTSTVNNFGVISASYADAVRLSQGGSVINGSASDKTASIISGPSGWGVNSSSGSVTNYGTITGSSGGIYLGSGTLINAGAITSATGSSGTAVDFGSGVSRLVEDAGSTLTGIVYGAGAGTTLELAAGKSGSIASGLVNVGAVAVDAGASWTVSGISSVPSVVDDGTVAIASGSSLDATSDVDPSSSGYFLLTSQSALEIAADLGTGLKIQFIGGSNKLTVDSAAKFGLNVGSTSYAGPQLLGFGATDSIDLKGIAPTGLGLNYSAATGDLQITGSAGSAIATLAFQNSSLGAGNFHAASDGAGGTLITHS